VRVLDSTLREGEQTPGVYFDPHIKLRIARLLDEVGVDVVEAGHPVVDPEIEEVVRRLSQAGLKATVAAHARSLSSDVDRALECGAGMIGIFYCVSESRLASVFGTDLATAVDRIATVIAYARKRRPDLVIRYTPEDAVRSEFDNVVAAAAAAVAAGADVISLADTTGCLIPGSGNSMYEWVSRVREALDRRGHSPLIAVHCHNDRGLALANALDGVRAGAELIDASVLGLGERAGIVDLASLLAVLATDFAADRFRLERLGELYALVSAYARIPVPAHFPVMGANAFTHCAGVHTQAAIRDPLHYQSLDPARLGRTSEICLDHMSGSASIDYALERIGRDDLGPEERRSLLTEVKAIGRKGRTISLGEFAHLVEFRTAAPLLAEAN
jgi:2-isopropylmalate synthase